MFSPSAGDVEMARHLSTNWTTTTAAAATTTEQTTTATTTTTMTTTTDLLQVTTNVIVVCLPTARFVCSMLSEWRRTTLWNENIKLGCCCCPLLPLLLPLLPRCHCCCCPLLPLLLLLLPLTSTTTTAAARWLRQQKRDRGRILAA